MHRAVPRCGVFDRNKASAGRKSAQSGPKLTVEITKKPPSKPAPLLQFLSTRGDFRPRAAVFRYNRRRFRDSRSPRTLGKAISLAAKAPNFQ